MSGVTWVALGAGAVAIGAGIADRGRRLRADLDRVGLIDWRTVQMVAMIVLIVGLGLGLQ